MEDLADVAERLRIVRAAQRRFLGWARVERELIDPLLDRVADALIVEAGADTPPQPGDDAGPRKRVER